MAFPFHDKVWRVLFIIGFPMMSVSAYMLHEAIWPGKGIFLDHIIDAANPASPSPSREYPPGDFSRMNTPQFWLLYYVPFAIGALLMIVGGYLRHSMPVPRHTTFDQMED